MPFLDRIFKPALDVYDKMADATEFDDIKQAAASGKTYTSKVLNGMLLAAVIFMAAFIWAMVVRPSAEELEREVQRHQVTSGKLAKCEDEKENKTNQIISLLEKGTTKLERVERKADTLDQKTDNNAESFNSTIKTLKNAVQKIKHNG